MATIRYSSRQKKWIVVWKSRGMTFRQECSSEEEAKAFSDAQETISRKEREFLVKRRRRKALTVEELFEKHFLVCLKSPLTIEQDRHHSNILLSFFGKKEISRITKKDIFAVNKKLPVWNNQRFIEEFLFYVPSFDGEWKMIWFPIILFRE